MNLKIRHRASRVQQFSVDGKQVHEGDQIQAFLMDEWVPVIFKLAAADDKAHGILPGGEVAVVLNKDMPLRWPKHRDDTANSCVGTRRLFRL
jgi:hypothetical protein